MMSFTDRTPPSRKHEPFQPPLEDPLSAGKRTLNALFDCFWQFLWNFHLFMIICF